MKKAAEMLDQLKVPYELTIVSAHRTPDRLTDYADVYKRQGECYMVKQALNMED